MNQQEVLEFTNPLGMRVCIQRNRIAGVMETFMPDGDREIGLRAYGKNIEAGCLVYIIGSDFIAVKESYADVKRQVFGV